MIKQFLRVKQIADQKFQRGEKSRLLTDELNAAEKRVDLIRESCCATGKKLSACMQRLTPDQASDRGRNSPKKIPEAALAQCMEEWGLSLGESSILGMTLVDYAGIQEVLATDLLHYKLEVEENVVEPLQNILSVDVNKIIKLRKQLVKLTSEMDAAKNKHQSAQRSSQLATGNGVTSAAAKAQLLKEETEDIVSRVDQCKDSMTAEMFNLISREPEMSQIFVKLCQLQLDYHRKAFYMLESALPELEAQIRNCAYQPVFGVALEDHLKVSKREIAIVIESCICWLLESAMEEEGLFRIGGSMIKIKKMKSAFDAGFHHLLEEERDPHNVAGILKLYLRSLPEPLLTYELYEHWMEAAVEPDHGAKLKALWSVVNSLPETHLKNLRYLIKFLSRFCQNSEVNKMSIQNVAIVIGPNLIWPHEEESALGMNMTATNLHSSIVDNLITYADWFFPGDCEFYVSTPTSPRHIEGFPPPASLYGSQLSLSTARLSNGDSAVDSMSSSPTNSSPKSPSPRVPVRPRKKAAPRAPDKSPITRSISCSGFQAGVLSRAAALHGSSLSISHENLLNAGYGENELVDGKKDGHSHPSKPPVVERRPKPPRQQNRNGVPPVAERSRRSVGRPSVPPPERPDSFSKSESVSSTSPDPPEVFLLPEEKVLDLEEISISFDSSESESYNECQMSFMDDSDSEGKDDNGTRGSFTSSYSNSKEDGTQGSFTSTYSNSKEDGTQGTFTSTYSNGKEDGTQGSFTSTYSNGTPIEKEGGVIDESFKTTSVFNSNQSFRNGDRSSNGTIGKDLEVDCKTSSFRNGNTAQDAEDGSFKRTTVFNNNKSFRNGDNEKGLGDDCKISSFSKEGTTDTYYNMEVMDDQPGMETVQLRGGGVLRLRANDGLSDSPRVKKPARPHISWSDSNSNTGNNQLCLDEEDAYSCHFTGGTPTWFDHYGDDKRQSNTLWFNNELNNDGANNRRSTLSCIQEDTSPTENYCTVIDVGKENAVSYRSSVSEISIKLRLNSETQDTRL